MSAMPIFRYSGVPDLVPGLADPLPTAELAQVPSDWAHRADVRSAHIESLRRILDSEIPPPARAEGDGILFCGGGCYWPMICIGVRMCREVTDLPIQVWHRGDAEPVDPADLADVPNVELIDATKFPARILRGWEIKGLALVNCGFERVLYLDADAYLVGDPSDLLDLLAPERPFVFWQDLAGQDRAVKWPAWEIPDAQGQAVPAIQGGQLAIHRTGFWRELVLFHWLNQHSDYSYSHGFGDQDQYRVALALTGQGYHCLGRAPWIHPAFVCRLEGQPLIVHRCRGKWFGSGEDKQAGDLPGEALAWQHRDRWLYGTAVDAGDVFARVYRRGLWGHGANSGGGSTPAEAAPYLELINGLIRMTDSRRIVDLGCGDGYITSRLQAPQLTGVDCCGNVDSLRKRFAATNAAWLDLDLDRDRWSLPGGDIALLKDVLHHWPTALIADWLGWANRSGKWKWLVCTYDFVNAHAGDIRLGGYRALDVSQPPFGLGLFRLCRYLHKEVAILSVRSCNSKHP